MNVIAEAKNFLTKIDIIIIFSWFLNNGGGSKEWTEVK